MRQFVVLAVLGAVLGVAACGDAPTSNDRHVSVTGEGAVFREPDIAVLRLGVSTRGTTAAEAMSANSESMRRVFATTESLGVAAADMKTSRLTINPYYRQALGEDGGRRSVIDGYEAGNALRITLREVDDVGAVIDALVAAGANQVDGLDFGVSDLEEARDEARAAAVADARRKAELYADAADVDLGDVVSISEFSTSGPVPVVRMEAAMAVPIAAGRNEISASVVVVWELD